MTALNVSLNSKKGDLPKHLEVFGGREHMLMCLTGSAGPGKNTAGEAAELFCQLFCEVFPLTLTCDMHVRFTT